MRLNQIISTIIESDFSTRRIQYNIYYLQYNL